MRAWARCLPMLAVITAMPHCSYDLDAFRSKAGHGDAGGTGGFDGGLETAPTLAVAPLAARSGSGGKGPVSAVVAPPAPPFAPPVPLLPPWVLPTTPPPPDSLTRPAPVGRKYKSGK